jgi:hypothetical protein
LTTWLEVVACLNNNSITKTDYHELNKIFSDRQCGFLATWFIGSVVLVFEDIIIEKSILTARHSSYVGSIFN